MALSQKPMNQPRRIFIIAGEASGDLHASNLVRAILKYHPDIKFEGLGGRRMADAGVHVLRNIVDDLAIMGFAAVIKHLPQLRELLDIVKQRLEATRPDAVLLVDYPGFNLRIARQAKKLGLRTIYYICPQTWAWHSSRAKSFPEILDHMMTIFPFEEGLFRSYGARATFVGHPLPELMQVTATRHDVCRSLNLDPQRPILSLLPGSRRSEVELLLPVMMQAAVRLRQEMPGVQFILPKADTIRIETIQAITRPYGLPLTVVETDGTNARAASDFAWVASGTATLETALLGVPMLILYKTSWVTYQIGRRLVNLPNIGLPNIVAGRKIVPELLQDGATPESILHETLLHMRDEAVLQRMKRDLEDVRQKMIGGSNQSTGAYDRAARVFLEQIGCAVSD